MILVVDMGNTHIELGIIDDDEIVLSKRIATDLNKTSAEYAVLLHSILEIKKVDVSKIEGAIISSVVPPLTYEVKEAIKEVAGVSPLIVGTGIKTGLKLKVEDPKIVGADLVVGSVAAVEEYGYPCLVVDMGTATTLVAIDAEGAFLGGAIWPGVSISLNALSDSAAKLPKIDLAAPKKVINSGTVESMQSGAVYGQASLIDGMVKKMKAELGYDTKVVATGGLAKLIVPYCETEIILDNNLMLKGLYIIY